MSKTLNVRTSVYDVTATVIVKNEDGIQITEHNITSDTKSIRAIKKRITDDFMSDGFTVIAIEDIKTVKRVIVKPYRINATIEEIVAACINSGLEVIEITDTNDNTDNEGNIA